MVICRLFQLLLSAGAMHKRVDGQTVCSHPSAIVTGLTVIPLTTATVDLPGSSCLLGAVLPPENLTGTDLK